METLERSYGSFKKAVIFSFAGHLALFLFILLSPHLPKSQRKGMTHYVNLVTFPGGGGGGGPLGGGGTGEEKIAETAAPKRETLKDLTTPQKIQEETTSPLRHPVEEPKKEQKPKKDKKAVIQRPQERLKKSPEAMESTEGSRRGTGGGGGSGVRIGFGDPGSGSGFGSGYSSRIGLSTFPYTYYLQIITNRVSAKWFTSLIDPGVYGSYQTTVYFKIHREGNISDLKIEESSGILSLDLSAKRAIRESAPFPELPRDYDGEYLVLHLIFEHSK